MGIVYVAVGMAAVPALLAVFHRLSRSPRTIADEAESWLWKEGPRP